MQINGAMQSTSVKKSIKHLLLLGLALVSATGTYARAASVDLLVLYDTHSKNYFSGEVETAMKGWVTQMNDAYAASQVDIQLRLVGVRSFESAVTDMSEALNVITRSAETAALRKEVGADFVSYLHKSGSCGVGWLSVSKNYAWNVTGPGCGPMTMVHELGHNMGLDHSRRQGDTSGSRYRYGLGYGVDNTFATIMAYPSAFKARRFNRFSNPEILCVNLPCGVPVGEEQEAFAALALNNVRNEIAGFSPVVIGGGNTSSTPVSSAARSSLAPSSLARSSIAPSSAARSSVIRSSTVARSSIAPVTSSSQARSSLAQSSSSVSTGPYTRTLEAEKFDASRGVRLKNTTDTGVAAVSVGYMSADDWMFYRDIEIPADGNYRIEYRLSGFGGRFELDVFSQGQIIRLAQVDVPRTGSWSEWTTVSSNVSLVKGVQSFGIYSHSSGWNINWWRIVKEN
jgi:peptidyl-Asp metalloendopeptidase